MSYTNYPVVDWGTLKEAADNERQRKLLNVLEGWVAFCSRNNLRMSTAAALIGLPYPTFSSWRSRTVKCGDWVPAVVQKAAPLVQEALANENISQLKGRERQEAVIRYVSEHA